MPLRDHFHEPLDAEVDGESFHSAWANTLVRHLNEHHLPARYRAVPEVKFPARDSFEVRVEDGRRRLVAAIELASPRNKDRPDSRRDFAIKCAAYLQRQVSVVIVDVVTDRHSDLFEELLALLDQDRGPAWPSDPPLYAVALRTTRVDSQWRLDTWEEPLALGKALPTMPLWLADNLAVPVDLESSYEDTLRVLKMA